MIAPVTSPDNAFPPLPAVSGPGVTTDVHPTVIVDSREQTPLVFRRLRSAPGTLTSGDYSFAGGEELFSVERKSIADVIACCAGENRGRFERELHRLRGFRFKRLLIVGARAEIEQHHYRSSITPKAALATLAAFEARYDLPVVWNPTPEAAARTVELWVWWFAREMVQTVNRLLATAPAPSENNQESKT